MQKRNKDYVTSGEVMSIITGFGNEIRSMRLRARISLPICQAPGSKEIGPGVTRHPGPQSELPASGDILLPLNKHNYQAS